MIKPPKVIPLNCEFYNIIMSNTNADKFEDGIYAHTAIERVKLFSIMSAKNDQVFLSL